MVLVTLKDYLARPDQTATKLAALLGVSVSTITRAASGDTLPTRKLMSRIAEATGGLVMPSDFLSDLDGQAAA